MGEDFLCMCPLNIQGEIRIVQNKCKYLYVVLAFETKPVLSVGDFPFWQTLQVPFLGVSDFEVEVKLQPTVSRPVCLGVRRPSGTHDQFFFLLDDIFLRQLQVCYFVAPCLTKGWVCNVLLLLVLASAVPPPLRLMQPSLKKKHSCHKNLRTKIGWFQ
jgi:hypothetical protein